MQQEDLQYKGSPWNKGIIKSTLNLAWERLRLATLLSFSSLPVFSFYYGVFGYQRKFNIFIEWSIYFEDLVYSCLWSSASCEKYPSERS